MGIFSPMFPFWLFVSLARVSLVQDRILAQDLGKDNPCGAQDSIKNVSDSPQMLFPYDFSRLEFMHAKARIFSLLGARESCWRSR